MGEPGNGIVRVGEDGKEPGEAPDGAMGDACAPTGDGMVPEIGGRPVAPGNEVGDEAGDRADDSPGEPPGNGELWTTAGDVGLVGFGL